MRQECILKTSAVVVEKHGNAYSKPIYRVTAANLRNAIKECAGDVTAIHTDELFVECNISSRKGAFLLRRVPGWAT